MIGPNPLHQTAQAQHRNHDRRHPPKNRRRPERQQSGGEEGDGDDGAIAAVVGRVRRAGTTRPERDDIDARRNQTFDLAMSIRVR
jgi:hypothetical protein